MKTLTAILLAIAAFLMCSSPPRAQAPAQRVPAPTPAAPTSMADAAYADIKSTLGFVPTFFRAVPPEAIAAAWEEMRTIQLAPETALSNRVKELIGLAVAAQVPCRYCVYAHVEFAKANGATERELAEAVAMAAITRHWSTVLNGMAVDPATFDKDIARVFAYLGKQKGKPAPAGEAITDASSAMKDIERTLGSVPKFFAAFPARGLPAAWREMKHLELNPATALDGKVKELIGLAVAAQVPCTYCIRFHTAAAKLHGATPQEIQEAVAMAAVTRHWSTILQGSQQDEAQFRRDINQLVKNAKPKTPKAAKR